MQFIDSENEMVDEAVYTSEYDVADLNTRRAFQANLSDLRSFKDAMQRSDRNEWAKARLNELNDLKDSWGNCDHTSDCRPVRCHTLSTVKRNADGSFGRYKVRMLQEY